MLEWAWLLALLAGSLVGFSLGLVGGGGSILAVPLLVYVVGIDDPHVAIGTSAVAVAFNAAANLIPHARKGNVKWRCAAVFAARGVLGALGGAYVGQRVDGERLLGLFAALMVVVGVLMLVRRDGGDAQDVQLGRDNLPKLVGGGFLIVPGLVWATGMPIRLAMASSLVAVAAFGVTTSASYALSGNVDWGTAALFIGGGVAGGLLGARAGETLAERRGALNLLFAALIFVVAGYMLYRTLG